MSNQVKMKGKLIKTLLFISLLVAANLFAQNSGKIKGVVIDQETGEAIIGANVILDGTMFGAASDIDGMFVINAVPEGNYTVTLSCIGYAKKTVTEVKVLSGQVEELNITLSPESYETEEVTITAKLLKNTDAVLLKDRQKSNSISDAISSESISRSGSGNAADAITKVTGTSVVSGKYVYIRGLGDRYSSTHLNGTELPSADPDVKSFNLDLFPSNLLDNIVTIKSFSPDKPGNFSGGLVNVATKDYPEKFNFRFSSSTAYNSNTTFNKNYLTYPTSSTDWLGYDNGSREIPNLLKDQNVYIPSPNEARRNHDLALRLDELTKSFNPEMSPIQSKAPMDQSYNLSIGDQLSIFGNPLGYIASLSYSRKYSFYENGQKAKWELSGNYDEVNDLYNYYNFSDTKGSEEVLIGGILNLSYKPYPSHNVGINLMYSQSGESSARYLTGSWIDQLGADGVYESRSLLYTERNLQSAQFHGEHYLDFLFGSTLEWVTAISKTTQDEPDLRFFSNDYFYQDDTTIVYAINKNSYNEPTRFFRNLSENNLNTKIDLSIPFKQWNDFSSNIKLGGYYLKSNREFRERRFELRGSKAKYNGDANNYFVDQAGLTDTTNGRYLFGNYVYDASTDRSNYDGDQTITAFYGMVELPIFKSLKFVGGIRYEETDMEVMSQDTTEKISILENIDWLPSLNFVYNIDENMNLRASFNKTLARPNFREISPFRSFKFLGDDNEAGNQNLTRTLINNYDLRWEWFSRPNEIYAISVFFKQFHGAIERVYDNTREIYTWQNVDNGYVYGAEFEIRKNLDIIAPFLSDFQFNFNFSFVYSQVDIPTIEYEQQILPNQPNAEKTRPLYGQSPYIVNFELSYINPEIGSTISLFYNIFGKRLSEVIIGATPDVYEQPCGMLDLTASQDLWYGFQLKLSAKNILNSPITKSINFKDNEYVFHKYSLGRTFSVGISYSL